MRKFLHRLFGLHMVEYYTGAGRGGTVLDGFTRGVCCCGYEGDVDMTGRFY
ncbi:hypothetical protein Jinkies_5 [Arthrobacter phage Jinkies]|uniref:Uncharacterized protein n=1 Tax=Arthrobacter phage Jinkies TaxID=2743903 RepID=A0A7S6BF79_9CAUD|nr:hypothetical protein Jinkies_5 [Arthrobacter phage Jinkies]